MKPRTLVWIIAAVAVVGVAYLAMSPAGGGGGTRNISAEETATLIEQGGVTILDVRTPGEFQAGHLPGAQNIPIDQLSSEVAAFDAATPVLVYCATGARSRTAVDVLQRAGVETIYHFSAGLVAWAGELDRPVVAGGAPAAPEPEPSVLPVMYEFFTDW